MRAEIPGKATKPCRLMAHSQASQMPSNGEEAKEQAEQCHESDPVAAELPLQTSRVVLSMRFCVWLSPGIARAGWTLDLAWFWCWHLKSHLLC